jgi:hypothetical protein
LRTFSFFWVFLEYFYKSPQNGILCSPPEKLKVPFWNPFERIYFFFDSYNPFKKENDVFFEDGLKGIILGLLRTFSFFWVFLEYFYKSPQNGILCSPPEKLKGPFLKSFLKNIFLF